MSPAAGPTRLARASVVRGGFSASSTSETGLVYRGRSTCVTSSCGCSTSSNSSSLSPLRSSSDIDGYRRESGGVWEGCWELCFVNVRVLPVGELKESERRVHCRSAVLLYSFFQRYSPTGTVTHGLAVPGRCWSWLAHVTRRSGVEAPAALVSSKRTSSSAVPLGAGSISESANSSRGEAARSNEKLTQLQPRAGSARGLLASR